ncbi:MAG: hypothetical protein GXP31_11650 [Kiritimatiellaeota bacterium]|nr:hypothetical protein [Kiritimatiellota bacterium]
MAQHRTKSAPPLLDAMNGVDVEERFMAAADGCRESAEMLCRAADAVRPASLSTCPAPVREAWNAGAELFCESLEVTADNADWASGLYLALARIGVELPLLRDRLAQAARRRFPEYADPSGLLRALGVHNREVPLAEIARRWRLFEALAPGRRCWLPAQGFGEIAGLDAVQNEVVIEFARRRGVSLQVCLAALVVVAPGSLFADLLENKPRPEPKKTGPEIRDELLGALIPAGRLREKDLEALLVPSIWTAAEFHARLYPENATDTEATPERDTAGRSVEQARDLQELVEALRNAASDWAPGPRETARMAELLRNGARRDKQETRMVEALARVQSLCADQAWWADLLRELSASALCWQAEDSFVRLSLGLAGKLQLSWFEAVVGARGAEWFAAAALGLPLKLLGRAAEALATTDREHLLEEKILAQARSGTAPADVLVWLWRKGGPEREALRDPSLLFRALGADTRRGPFIEARKVLRKLLVDDAGFQRFMVRDGDADAAGTLVRAVRHTAALTPGERQSILVKLVRLYPGLKNVVEQKTTVAAAPTQRPQTSFRSYELRRRELEEIINVRIPANSRAIAHARSYGDLRENAEYKTAKDEQRQLGRRRTDLEQMLHETMPTDFSDVRIQNRILPGCTVVLDCGPHGEETYHVLGLWDSDPERRILAYGTPMGQALLGLSVGDSVELPDGTPAVIREIRPLSKELQAWVRGEDLH